MDWFQRGVVEALAEAKERQAVLLIHIIDNPVDADMSAWQSPQVLHIIHNSAVVALLLRNGTEDCNNFRAFHEVPSVPTTFLIDAQSGRVIHRVSESTTSDYTTQLLSTLRQTFPNVPEEGTNDIEGAFCAESKEAEKLKQSERNRVMELQKKIRKMKKVVAQNLAAQGQDAKKDAPKPAKENLKTKQPKQTKRMAKASNTKSNNLQPKEIQEEGSPTKKEETASEARIRFKLPDGTHLTATFQADDTLAEIRAFLLTSQEFVDRGYLPDVRLRQIGQNDELDGSGTLAEFGLVPRSQVLVMASVEQEEEQSFCDKIFGILNPRNFLPTAFGGFPGVPVTSAPRTPETHNTPSTSAAPSDPFSSTGPTTLRQRRPPSNSSPARGNVHTFRNTMDDDDPDRNRGFNGDSTETIL
eukprot:m.25831 g.25831  ORF g.25831 m.25831 type:complete len:413 (-) comp7741_c0_seq1:168-1406(-)